MHVDSVTSKTQIALVIGIGATAIIASFIAFSKYDWMSSWKGPQEEKRIELLQMTKELPEVKSFVSKYPGPDPTISSGMYSYDPRAANFTSIFAVVTYSGYQKDSTHLGMIFHPAMSVYLQKSSQPSGQNNAGGEFDPKPFRDLYYYAVPQCTVNPMDPNVPMPGFLKGTDTAILYKDCNEVEKILSR